MSPPCNLCDSKLLKLLLSSSVAFLFLSFFAVWTETAGIVCGGVMREGESGSEWWGRRGGGERSARRESHYTVQEVVELCVCIWT